MDLDEIRHPMCLEKCRCISDNVREVEQDTVRSVVTLQDVDKHIACCATDIHNATQAAEVIGFGHGWRFCPMESDHRLAE